MNRSKLFQEVKNWLLAEKLAFVADEEESDFQVGMQLDNGLVQVRLICEETPTFLQVMVAHPVKVPEEKASSLGLLLHKVNGRLRIGSFQYHDDERVVTFRITMPIRVECDLGKQFAEAFGATLSTTDGYFQPLGLFCCSTEQAQELIAKMAPETDELSRRASLPAGRLELN